MAEDEREGVLAGLDMSRTLKRHEYEEQLAALQGRFEAIQQAYFTQGLRGVVVFEGWDAAGKGGAIRKISSVMDPRGLKVWPIGAPEPQDLRRHYLARFWQRVPQDREICVFDRSWYGRVLVERVEGLAKESEWRRAYREIEEFERQLVDDGTRIAKVFLYITPDEQLKRFERRLADPLKHWKLSFEDFRNRERWQDYERAAGEMLEKTSFTHAPWLAIPANSKRYARIAALGEIADRLSHGVELAPRPVAEDIRRRFETLAGRPASSDAGRRSAPLPGEE